MDDLLNGDLIDEIIIEVREHLEEAVNHILIIEKNPEDEETVHALFRNFHTIKGNADFAGLARIVRLSHLTESLLDSVREKTIKIDAAVIEVLLKSIDFLTALVDEVQGGTSFDEDRLEDFIRTLSQCLPPEAKPAELQAEQSPREGSFAYYSYVLVEVSRIFDQIISLAMSAKFNINILNDIQEKADRLTRSVKETSFPRARNMLGLFQGCAKVIRDHSLPFSENNFGLFKDLFVTFIDTLTAEFGETLGVRQVRATNLWKGEALSPVPGNSEEETRTYTSCAIVDLRGIDDLEGEARVRFEERVKEVCRTYKGTALIDSHVRAFVDPGTPCFVSPLEALQHIIRSMEKG